MTSKTLEILERIEALDEAEFNELLSALDAAMWDEWDCSLPNGLEMFGIEEIKIAVRTAKLIVTSRSNAENN